MRVVTAVATYINYCGKMMANLRGYIGIIYTLTQSNLSLNEHTAVPLIQSQMKMEMKIYLKPMVLGIKSIHEIYIFFAHLIFSLCRTLFCTSHATVF